MSTWHVDREPLARLRPRRVDVADAFSIEAHLLACDDCQAAVAPRSAPARLDATWAEIVDPLDAPRLGPVERAAGAARRARARRAAARRHARRCTLSWFVAVARGAGRSRSPPRIRASAGCVVPVPRGAVAGRRRRRGVHARARSRPTSWASPPRSRAFGCCSCATGRCSSPRSLLAGLVGALALPGRGLDGGRLAAALARRSRCAASRSPRTSPHDRVRRRDGGMAGDRDAERRRRGDRARRVPTAARSSRSSRSPPWRPPCSSHHRDRLDLGRGSDAHDRPRDRVCKRLGTTRALAGVSLGSDTGSPACSAPTARARRRSCGSSPPCCGPTRAASGSSAATRRRGRAAGHPAPPGLHAAGAGLPRALHRLRVRRLRRHPQGA